LPWEQEKQPQKVLTNTFLTSKIDVTNDKGITNIGKYPFLNQQEETANISIGIGKAKKEEPGMKDITVTDSILYIGADDKDLDLFESQYIIPNGVSYNSYVIMDEKIAVMDTVDARRAEEWLDNLDKALAGRTPDYLIVSHMEPDHAANIQRLVEKYPEMKVVGNPKTFPMIGQFFDVDLSERSVVVKEGETLNLGKHELQFFMAPMVHWPEVMVTYEKSERFFLPQMASVSLVHWMWKKTGLAKQDVTISILSENMVFRYRHY